MMKLILASDFSFLLKYGYNLTGISKAQMRIGYVITASKGARDKEFFENLKTEIHNNEYNFEEFDIEDKSLDEMRAFFRDKNIIHVEGGNTFYLLKVIRKVRFGEVIKELLDDGKIYIGTSAGAYIMCPTIEVADWNNSGKSRFGVTDFTALNYVPFLLKVHYRDESKDIVIEKNKTLKYPLRILRDGQGLVVEDGKCRFVGDEDEVKIT